MAFTISPKRNEEHYNMRGTADRRSDRVTCFTRTYGSRTVDISRVNWASGGSTIRVFEHNMTTKLHHFGMAI